MANDIISFQPEPGGTYVAPDHIYETLPDGRVIQIARKDQPLAQKEAIRLGLVKAPPEPPVVETKDLEAPPAPVVTLGAPPVNTGGGAAAPFGAERMAAAPPKGATAASKASEPPTPPTPAP